MILVFRGRFRGTFSEQTGVVGVVQIQSRIVGPFIERTVKHAAAIFGGEFVEGVHAAEIRADAEIGRDARRGRLIVGHIFLIVAKVKMHGCSDLPEIVLALTALSDFFCLVEDGQQHSRQNRDDRYHDQQFYQCEFMPPDMPPDSGCLFHF
ncbi:hypothetical protein SDC9_142300 [bioreactor metagenome]|uniref:Uncharacterized protein n=1 Tax=bioreactor metagenome TaxID=1076179 RepID=A0A645E0S4_9ZZZZ